MSSEFQNKNIQLKSTENKGANEKEKTQHETCFWNKMLTLTGLLQVSVAVCHTLIITLLI